MVRRISVKPKDGFYDSGSEYRSHRGKSLWVSNRNYPFLKSEIVDNGTFLEPLMSLLLTFG